MLPLWHTTAALHITLHTVLYIDLLDPAVCYAWTLSLCRPLRPVTAPSWNLQQVLQLRVRLLTLPLMSPWLVQHSSCPCAQSSTSRFAGLCVQLSDYSFITLDGTLRIRPLQAFLAKNALSHSRWPHSNIEPLFNSVGSRSGLYPMNNIQLCLVALNL